MRSIQEAMGKIVSFRELKAFITEAKADISFYGMRCIRRDKFSGIYFLDTLARRVDDLMQEIIIFSPEDISDASFVGNKVTQFYRDTDSCVNKNILTRTCYRICEFLIENFDNFGRGEKGIRLFWCDQNISFEMRYRKKLANEIIY